MTTGVILSSTAKILVVKLADLGDVLTATPALRALRQRYPNASIDVLLTHYTQPVLQYSTLADTLIPSDNFRFFALRDALNLSLPAEGWRILQQIWRGKYDAVVILHHLTTRAGTLKYAAIAHAAGAKVVAGVRPPGKRGRFLTHCIPDRGFGFRHEIDTWLDVVGLLDAPPVGRNMELPVSPADERWATEIIHAKAGNRPPVIIHPGSGGFNPARRWSAQNFAAVADEFINRDFAVALVGSPTDGTDAVQAAMAGDAIDLTGKTTLHQLAALIHHAALFIGGDSGVSHVAAASGAPMVSIFGPTNAAAWGADAPHQRVLQAAIPCAPCAYVGHAVGLRNGCDAKTCLKIITPAQAIKTALAVLGSDDKSVPATLPPHSTVDSHFPTANILGIRLHAVTAKQVIAAIETFVADGAPHQICTVNPEFVMAAQRDIVFRQIINRAALAFADGNGLLKAARWLGQPSLPERIAGVDTVVALAELSAQKGYRIFFLGARPGIAEKTVAILKTRYPAMVAAGAFAGSPAAAEEDAIVARIQAARPDIILVAYGAPRQDKWIARNMYRLPAAVLMGVGGAFDFISGATVRAPQWMQSLGLEWLHRFLHQPWRWRRIWNAVPHFLWLIGREKILGGKNDIEC